MEKAPLHTDPLWARALPYALAFAVPCAVLAASFAANGIFPFGDVSVMLYDMPVQYAEFFGWLSDVLHGQGNLLYSSAAGLGGGTFALFTYYLSSPFNLLVAAVDPAHVPQFMSALYLVKLPAAGVTCLVFLRGRFPDAGAKAPARSQALGVALACAYALTSYAVGYASNIMWIDGVIMLPLACLGVIRLVQGRGCVLLFASAALAVLFNWYTGYMICLFCLAFFAYELFLARAKVRGARARWRLVGRFVATGALAVGAAAVVLVPTAVGLLGGKGAGAGIGSLFGSVLFSLNPLDLLNYMGIGTIPGIVTSKATPAIVVSALALVGAAAYFCNGALPRAERVASGCLLAFLVASFVLVPVNTVWTGFVPESSYTNRNGFVLLFIVVALACKGILSLSGAPAVTRRRAVVAAGVIVCCAFVAASFNVWFRTLSVRPSAPFVALEAALIAGFAALLFAAVRFPRARSAACVLVAALFLGEQFVAADQQLSVASVSASAYTSAIEDNARFYEPLAGEARGGSFVRVGQTAPYTGTGKWNGPDDASMLTGVSNFDHYSSTQEANVQRLLERLGYSKVTPFGTYYDSPNPVADALLGMTHVVDDAQPPLAEEVTGSAAPAPLRGTYRLYRATDTLPLGYGVAGASDDAGGLERLAWTDDPFRNQELMLSAVAGCAAGGEASVYRDGAVAEVAPSIAGGRTFEVTPSDSGPLFLYAPSIMLRQVEESGIVCDLYVNGALVQTVGGRGSCNLVYAGTFPAGEQVQVTLVPRDPAQVATDADWNRITVADAFGNVTPDQLLVARTLDEDAFRSALGRVDAQGFELHAFANGAVDASFTAAQDETLVVAIPFEPGWTARVNGKAVGVEEAFDGLLSVPVSAGANEVELRYRTPGLDAGAAVSVVSLAAFCAWRGAVAKRRRRERQMERADGAREEQVQA